MEETFSEILKRLAISYFWKYTDGVVFPDACGSAFYTTVKEIADPWHVFFISEMESKLLFTKNL